MLLVRFVHPRFGPIKCIRTIRAVQKDEELTVAYGYDHEPSGKSGPEAPDWYKQELHEFQEQEAERRAKDYWLPFSKKKPHPFLHHAKRHLNLPLLLPCSYLNNCLFNIFSLTYYLAALLIFLFGSAVKCLAFAETFMLRRCYDVYRAQQLYRERCNVKSEWSTAWCESAPWVIWSENYALANPESVLCRHANLDEHEKCSQLVRG